MKTLAFILLLSIFSTNAMQRLKDSSSSDLEPIKLNKAELEELENQRKLTPVPSLNCFYADIQQEKNARTRFTIDKLGVVVARHNIAERPATW